MVIKDDKYILGISKPYGKEEKEIHEICTNAPVAPDGYIYKMRLNKTWELCEKPISKECANNEEDFTDAEFRNMVEEAVEQ